MEAAQRLPFRCAQLAAYDGPRGPGYDSEQTKLSERTGILDSRIREFAIASVSAKELLVAVPTENELEAFAQTHGKRAKPILYPK